MLATMLEHFFCIFSSSLGHYCVCLQNFYKTIVYDFINFRTALCMLATILEHYFVCFYQV